MYLAIMAIGGIVGGLVASNKGRMVFVWTVACGLMPLALLILLALPRLPKVGVWRPCPLCLRIIPWQATVCAACLRNVPPPHAETCPFCTTLIWAGEGTCSKCGRSPQDEHNESKKED